MKPIIVVLYVIRITIVLELSIQNNTNKSQGSGLVDGRTLI
jgi:hypothetical protein